MWPSTECSNVELIAEKDLLVRIRRCEARLKTAKIAKFGVRYFRLVSSQFHLVAKEITREALFHVQSFSVILLLLCF